MQNYQDLAVSGVDRKCAEHRFLANFALASQLFSNFSRIPFHLFFFYINKSDGRWTRANYYLWYNYFCLSTCVYTPACYTLLHIRVHYVYWRNSACFRSGPFSTVLGNYIMLYYSKLYIVYDCVLLFLFVGNSTRPTRNRRMSLFIFYWYDRDTLYYYYII